MKKKELNKYEIYKKVAVSKSEYIKHLELRISWAEDEIKEEPEKHLKRMKKLLANKNKLQDRLEELKETPNE